MAILSSPPPVPRVEITPEELISQSMSKQNIEKAVVALTSDGVVILDNAVDHAALDLLNPPMFDDAKRLPTAAHERSKHPPAYGP